MHVVLSLIKQVGLDSTIWFAYFNDVFSTMWIKFINVMFI
jgi:hypothetical protein